MSKSFPMVHRTNKSIFSVVLWMLWYISFKYTCRVSRRSDSFVRLSIADSRNYIGFIAVERPSAGKIIIYGHKNNNNREKNKNKQKQKNTQDKNSCVWVISILINVHDDKRTAIVFCTNLAPEENLALCPWWNFSAMRDYTGCFRRSDKLCLGLPQKS